MIDIRSGRSYFASIVLGLCINVGHIANMHRNSNFPFNNCTNKRILYWDEPNYEPSALETLKMIFSGNTCPVALKNRDFGNVHKTPTLVTANTNVFPMTGVFQHRIRRYFWKEAH